MGTCVSCESASVATAKVILEDGRLLEYSYPIKASHVISKDNLSTFLCNSDDMEFDDVVSAVRDDEELQPGQLYFVLPLCKLRCPLQPEEMAALAVKANAALLKNGAGAGNDKCRCRKKCSSASFFESGYQKSGRAVDGEVAVRMRNTNRRMSRNRNGGRKKFNANLTVIPE